MLIINSITTGGRELLTERYIFPAFRSGTHIRPIETTLRENFSSVLSMRSPNCQRLATMTRDRGRETGSNYSGSDSAQCGCFKAKRPLFLWSRIIRFDVRKKQFSFLSCRVLLVILLRDIFVHNSLRYRRKL